MSTIKERETHLLKMREHLESTKVRAELLCYGYEVIDAINELIGFAEFDLDELEVEYDGGI